MTNTIRQDLQDLKTGPRELRNFGLLVGGLLFAFGLLALLRHKPYHVLLLGPGGTLLLLGILLPSALKHVYLVWMAVAFVLGFIVSHLILAAFFFLVVTPVALASRIARKDFLRLKLDGTADTYWIPRIKPKGTKRERYEQQF